MLLILLGLFDNNGSLFYRVYIIVICFVCRFGVEHDFIDGASWSKCVFAAMIPPL